MATPSSSASGGEVSVGRLVLTTHYWHPHTGGIETVAAAHSTELLRRGWHISAHTARSDRDSPSPEVLAPGAVLQRHAALNPLETRFRVPVPFPLPGAGRRLASDVVDASVVVAHGHVYPMSVLAARAARRHRRPFVLIQHSPWVDYPRPIDTIERLADRTVGKFVIESADRVICVSRFTERYVRTISPEARTEVIPNGVDTTRFVPAQRIDDGTIRFLTVRRLVPRNGVDLLLDAWRVAGLDHARLVIAGDGPERQALEARAAGLTGVTFTGRVADEQLTSLMQQAHASIVPTRSGEGFGLVAAESLACGTPVIAMNQGALAEVVRDGVDGMLVPEGRVDLLAVALRTMTNDATLRRRLADAALDTDWSWRSVGDRLDAVLRSIASA
jgi:glycosyltransferase involved in cell wall biosynthesis